MCYRCGAKLIAIADALLDVGCLGANIDLYIYEYIRNIEDEDGAGKNACRTYTYSILNNKTSRRRQAALRVYVYRKWSFGSLWGF